MIDANARGLDAKRENERKETTKTTTIYLGNNTSVSPECARGMNDPASLFVS